MGTTNNKVITVLTPAYNKANTIGRTFNSLLLQSCYDFEWVIVNDGSTDGTKEVIDSFKTDKFPISICHKENEGLNRTWNRGIQIAKGELILRLDPDDYLVHDAIQEVLFYYLKIKDSSQLCGIVFLMKYADNSLVGTHPFKEIVQSDFLDYRVKWQARGDRLEIVKRDVFINYPMVEFENEKFCSESVMWENIAFQYSALYIPKAICIHEYQANGITQNMVRVLRANPIGAAYAYKHSINMHIRRYGMCCLKRLLFNTINYFRFAFSTSVTRKHLFEDIPYKVCLIGVLPGLILYLIDCCAPNLINFILLKIRNIHLE